MDVPRLMAIVDALPTRDDRQSNTSTRTAGRCTGAVVNRLTNSARENLGASYR